MLSAAELNFATRNPGELPAWLRETLLRIWRPEEAKILILRTRGREVLVKLRERSGVLVGEICGFEPSVAAPDGLQVGDLIVFRPSHVFAVRE